MNDTKNVQNPQDVNPPVNTQATAPASPVSGGHKENAPVPQVPEKVEIKPSDVEPKLEPEVVKAGVEVKNSPTLSPLIKRLGVKETGEAVKLDVGQDGQAKVALPMTQVQAKQAVSSNNTNSSLSWIATLILKLLKRDNRKVFDNYD